MNRFILGIDMAKASFDLHILDHHKPKRSSSFSNDINGFERMLADVPQGEVVLGVESTSTYHLELVEWAHGQGWEVFVLNPARVKANTQTLSPTHKTDAIDAWSIAEFVRQKHHLLRPWKPMDPAWEHAKALSRRRASVDKLRVQELNRLEALPRAQTSMRKSINRMLKMFTREVAKLDAELDKVFESNEKLGRQVKLLMTIPGVGKVLASTMSAEYGELERHENAKALTARTGIVPMEKSSGSSVRGKSRLKRTGNARVRRVLYMAAMSALRSRAWQGWISHRRDNKKTGKKLVIAIMDKLLRLCFGVMKSGKPFDERTAFAS